MVKKILVVTKDIMEYAIYQPVVKLLREKGFLVTIVAEGLSLKEWKADGESIIGGTPLINKWDPETKIRHDINVVEVFETIKPDVVLTGLGSPINLGESFGLEANRSQIKLGYIVDVWGAEARSSAIPNFVCVPDTYSQNLVQRRYENKATCYLTGLPSWDNLKEVSFDENINQFASNFKKRILIAGQSESTTPLIEGLIKALDDSGDDYLLMPRLHPKFVDRQDLPIVDKWLRILAKAHGHVLWVPPTTSIQTLMLTATHTVSIYSNALTEAAMLYSLPISWNSDIGRKEMIKELGGIERFPLVDLGCAIEVQSAEDFNKLIPDVDTEAYVKIIDTCRKTYCNDRLATKRVVDAIVAELG
ncbi:MAG: hypothetical protein WC666_03090 [Candidatus Paceibacterota bacterium]